MTVIEVLLAALAVLMAAAIWTAWQFMQALMAFERTLARLAQASEDNLAVVERINAERARQPQVRMSLMDMTPKTRIH